MLPAINKENCVLLQLTNKLFSKYGWTGNRRFSRFFPSEKETWESIEKEKQFLSNKTDKMLISTFPFLHCYLLLEKLIKSHKVPWPYANFLSVLSASFHPATHQGGWMILSSFEDETAVQPLPHCFHVQFWQSQKGCWGCSHPKGGIHCICWIK